MRLFVLLIQITRKEDVSVGLIEKKGDNQGKRYLFDAL